MMGNADILAAIAQAQPTSRYALLDVGEYEVTPVSGYDGITIPSGIILKGKGPGVTVVRKTAIADCRPLVLTGGVDIGIEDMSVDGRGDTAAVGVHTISCGDGGVNGLGIKRCWIYDGFGYNIGLQGGAIKNVVIEDCEFWGSGADAIDVKNLIDLNNNIQIRRNRIRTFATNIANTLKAGIDLRGTGCVVEDITFDLIGFSHAGVRMRQGEGGGGANGYGAHGAVVRRITGTGDNAGTLVYVASRDCTISDLEGHDLTNGVQVLDSDNTITRFAFTSVTRGIDVSNVTTFFPHRTRISYGSVGSGSNTAYNFEAVTDCQVIQCTSAANNGAVIDATCQRIAVVGNTAVTDSGTATMQSVHTNAAWQTACNNAGLTALAYEVTAIDANSITCQVLRSIKGSLGWIGVETSAAGSLATAATQVAAAVTAVTALN